MAKGIIYVMTTVVPGLIKIGKTGTGKFESRMYHLERNGYCNVVGLQRKFAIEVDDYDAKEQLLDDIFSKSNVPGSELFALDADLVVQLLSSFEGRQIYPKTVSKTVTFKDAVKERKSKEDFRKIPDGIYFLNRMVKGFGKLEARMKVEKGTFTLLKGCTCRSAKKGVKLPEIYNSVPIVDGVLQEDVMTNSPSTAGCIVLGGALNGWVEWKTKSGKPINIYRKKIDG